MSEFFKVARRLGEAAGRAAGAWILDGNNSDEDARYLLRCIEDGDPALEPPAPLSGEWAGDQTTPASLVRDVLDAVGIEDASLVSEDDMDSICDVYEDAFLDAWYAEVERSARAMLD